CRQNLVYWQSGAYLGLGLGAASFYDHTRYKNISDLSVYLGGSRSEEEGGDHGKQDCKREEKYEEQGGESGNSEKEGDYDGPDKGSTNEREEEYEEKYEEKEALTQREEMEEFFFLGLRLMRGVSQSAFRAQFGENKLRQFERAIESGIEDGLMERTADGDGLRLTRRGIDLSNTVFVRFLE
ncbi:MAG: hypothetical protein LUE87_08640, partial [Lachnospiraceae bacterium]|nr:hypothetical protein [Lachnospiraceae bacterium]